jgi:hypothetical protein
MLLDREETRGATALPEIANAARVMNSDRSVRVLSFLRRFLTSSGKKVSSSIIAADNGGNNKTYWN